ncbi:hypothetical protein [Treponema denticola]|uniref:hypothetical protein n=1 Tax=Treponema denticola TaxID=158 RepID=UPI00210496A1|nr:hypothetical protein [Treponema denticola]UTY26370.1 hypothetical protein E4N77_06595 [Treponema denticola]
MLGKKLLCLLSIFIFFSCGIDNIVYLEPPKLIHDPTGHPSEYLMYFEFETSDKNNLGVGEFLGFEVYYRIYESETDCINLIKNILQYNESNPANSVNYLLSSYNYKLLTYEGHLYQDRPIVPASGSPVNRRVRFFIEALISYPNNFSIDGTIQGKVLRQLGEDFAAAKSGDYDVQSSSNPSNDSFYVAVFAATYGVDTTFRPVYSSLISLGYVKIKKNT